MKALTVQSLSSDLSGVELRDIEAPVRGPGEVLVKVRAVSLNFPDLLMTRGEYQLKPPLPFVLGLEFAGEVLECEAASGWAPGDLVYGGRQTGCFAEQVAVPTSALRRVPAGLSLAQAAAFGAAYSTAYTALVELGGLTAGQWVLVHGASGGVGLAACDLAKALGAKVIAASGSPERLGSSSARQAAAKVVAA